MTRLPRRFNRRGNQSAGSDLRTFLFAALPVLREGREAGGPAPEARDVSPHGVRAASYRQLQKHGVYWV
jgi:hypothetical protein